MLTIARLQHINAARAEIWHSNANRQWSLLEWAGAMCGEAGEAANIAKKIIRIESGTPGNNTSDHVLDGAELTRKLAHEIADTILYATLLASNAGVDLEHAIITRFNEKSTELTRSGAVELPRWVVL